MQHVKPPRTFSRKKHTRSRKPLFERLEDRLAPASGTIQGVVWSDLNISGVQDAGEAGLAGRTVFLDANGNGVLDAGEPSQATGANGGYTFTGLAAGPYNVTEVQAAGWVQTAPRSSTLTAGSLAPALWQPRGPTGGDGVAVAVSPQNNNLVLAALASDTYHGGLFRSSDGGATWVELSAFVEKPVLSAAIAGNGTMYVGNYEGLWRSTDNGVNWTSLDIAGQAGAIVLAIGVQPGSPNTFLVALNGGFSGVGHTIFKTSDGGTTWIDVTPAAAAQMTPAHIGFNPANASDVYLTFGGSLSGANGIFYSADAGSTWIDRTPGLPSGPLEDVAFDGSGVLVAGGHPFGSQNVGLYRSTDTGVNWTSLSDSWPSRFAHSVAVDPSNPSLIVVGTEQDGVYQSSDGGASWTFHVPGTATTQVDDVAFSGAGILAAASAFGVLRSGDGAVSFSASTTGMSEFDVLSVAVNPLNRNEMAVAAAALNIGLVMTTQDGGQSWQMEPTPTARWASVWFSPSGVLFAVNDLSSTYQEGLYRRNGDGTWTGLGPSFTDFRDVDVRTVAFSASDPNLIVAAGQTVYSDNPDERQRASIWRSADAGVTWTRVWIGTEWATAVTDVKLNADGSVLLAGVIDEANQVPVNSTVLRSVDGGVTWNPSNSGLPANVQPIALATSATNPGKVYLANYYAYFTGLVYLSTDGGQSWTATLNSNQVDGTAGVVVDPNDDRVVYIEGAGAGISRSENSGATFVPIVQGLDNSPLLPYGRPALKYAAGATPRLLTATRGGVYSTELLSSKPTPSTVNLADGQTVSGIDFGTRPLWGEIKGSVWEDSNGDGINFGEFVRPGWTVFIDANSNGALDPGERSFRTSGFGDYHFTGMEPGTYTVRLQMQPGCHQTAPAANAGYSVTVAANGSVAGKDFGFQPNPTEIHGTKWNDANGNGVLDSSEPALAGWTIYIDANGNGKLDAGEPSTLTDAQGKYALTNLQAGTYLVAEKPPLYWVQTSPGDGKSHYDPNLGFGFTAGWPTWADHDASTPNVIDIWYDYRPFNGYANQITAAEIADIEADMTRWSQATAGRLNFLRNTQAAASDIIDIGTGDLAAVGYASGAGGVLGAGGATPDGSNHLADGVMWMDVADTWDTTIGNGDVGATFDYFTVAGHELGHAIGLAHAENLSWQTLMGPFYSGEQINWSAADVDQVRSLYGANEDKGLGFHVIKLPRGQIRDNVNFGSKRGVIPFSDLALDFGTATSPVASGYTRATSVTVYDSAAGGYGWTSGSVTDLDRGTADALTRDFAASPNATFVVDAPAGSYDVTIILGDASKKRDSMEVYLEGTRVETVTTQSGQFSTQTFRVTVTDGQLTIRINDAGGKDPDVALNALRVTRVLPVLTVSLSPATVSEAAGANASTGTVTRDGDLSQALVVTLTSSDTTEATTPATVTIPAGQTSANFAIAAVDDSIIDNTQTSVITASANGYRSGTATLSVTDNDAPTFTSVSFDFGTSSSPVAAGFRQVTPSTTYSVAQGYGWLSGTITATDRGTGTDVNRDFNSTPLGTFVVNVPNGTYSVVVTMGDATTAHDKMAVSLEGSQVANLSSSAGQFLRNTYQVTVSNGQLTLALDDRGGRDPVVVINALEISRVSGGPLLATSLGGNAHPFWVAYMRGSAGPASPIASSLPELPERRETHDALARPVSALDFEGLASAPGQRDQPSVNASTATGAQPPLSPPTIIRKIREGLAGAMSSSPGQDDDVRLSDLFGLAVLLDDALSGLPGSDA